MGKCLFAWAQWYWFMDHMTLKAKGMWCISVCFGNSDFRVEHKGKSIPHRTRCKPKTIIWELAKGKEDLCSGHKFVCLLLIKIKKTFNQSATTIKAGEQYLLLLFDYVKGLAMAALNRIFSSSILKPTPLNFSSYKVLTSTSWCHSTIPEVLWNIILLLYFWILEICCECWKQVYRLAPAFTLLG